LGRASAKYRWVNYLPVPVEALLPCFITGTDTVMLSHAMDRLLLVGVMVSFSMGVLFIETGTFTDATSLPFILS